MKKIYKKFFIQLHRAIFCSFCDIWQPLSNWNGYNSKSIELRKISKVIASCYRRPLQNEKEKKKIGTKLWRLGPRKRARASSTLRINIFFQFETILVIWKHFRNLSPLAIAVAFKMRLGARVWKINCGPEVSASAHARAPVTDEVYLCKYLLNHFLFYNFYISIWKLVFFLYFRV